MLDGEIDVLNKLDNSKILSNISTSLDNVAITSSSSSESKKSYQNIQRKESLRRRKSRKQSTNAIDVTKGLICSRFKEDRSTLFKIYLSDNLSKKEEASFGKVIDGFDLLNKIYYHNDISRIKILDCGLVISLDQTEIPSSL